MPGYLSPCSPRDARHANRPLKDRGTCREYRISAANRKPPPPGPPDHGAAQRDGIPECGLPGSTPGRFVLPPSAAATGVQSDGTGIAASTYLTPSMARPRPSKQPGSPPSSPPIALGSVPPIYTKGDTLYHHVVFERSPNKAGGRSRISTQKEPLYTINTTLPRSVDPSALTKSAP